MKIYIAGKITGLQKHHYTAAFKAAEIQLRAAGHNAVNPCSLGISDDSTSDQALLVCLLHLRSCDAIYLLPDWADSHGAVIERQFAIDNGKEVIYHDRQTALIHQPA